MTVRESARAFGGGGGTVACPGGVPGWSADSHALPAGPSTPFYGSGRVKAAIDRSEESVGLHWEQGGDLAGGSSRPHRPSRRNSKEGPPRIKHPYSPTWYNLGKLVNHDRHAARTASSEEVTGDGTPPRTGRPVGCDRDQSLRHGSL